ncbi:MAG: Pyrimidine 5'-nucleotidase YjjG [Calditrichaeota bacterium]|nr:Pyrimidine 5'-nucleotidase YjjG [Calditrichota bacterium]
MASNELLALNGRTIEALTIDFWGTIAHDVNYERRGARRRDYLRSWFAAHGAALADEAVLELMKLYARQWRDAWLNHHYTPGADHAARWYADAVELHPPDGAIEALARHIDDSIRDVPPAPVAGALDAVARLAEICPLALVCDTGLSGGENIRWVLERWGIAGRFRALVFSDAVGVSKPHRKMFRTAVSALGAPAERAAHIGDREDTDIAGAKRSGMAAIRFDGARDLVEWGPESEADEVVNTWSELLDLLLADGER